MLPAADRALLSSHSYFLAQLQKLAEANAAFLQEVLAANGHGGQDEEDSNDGLAGIESEADFDRAIDFLRALNKDWSTSVCLPSNLCRDPS